MKTFTVTIFTFGLGLVTGLGIGNHFIVATVRNQFRSGSAQHQSLALVSVHALDELQAGHVDSAKSFLARQIAYYYRSIQQFDLPSPQKQELLHHIQASSATSPELKDALSRGLSEIVTLTPNQTLQPNRSLALRVDVEPD